MAEESRSGHRKRIRERFLAGEEKSLSDIALLELLLTYAIPQKDVQPLAEKLVSEFGGLSPVLRASPESLTQFDGLKSSSAVLLKLVDWIRYHYPTDDAVLGTSSEAGMRQLRLFETGTATKDVEDQPEKIEKTTHRERILPRRGTELFSKAVLKEAIAVLPELPDTESLDEIRDYLRGKLHYSAEQTRHRYANYIVRRMFPEGHADAALRRFAKTYYGDQSLRDVCFYRFLKAEPLEINIIEDLLIPNIGNGRLNREKIRSYIHERFPASRSIKDCAQAAVDALSAAGIAKVDKVKIAFSYREIPIPALAFVLYSEFPEPGMYDLPKLEENRVIRAMMWNPSRLLDAVYELRNRGIISKVSEIDNVRQFTTKWSLDELTKHLALEGTKV